MSEYIPANPPANSRGMHGVTMANDVRSVRDRQVVIVPEAAPLEDEQIPVQPVARRRFIQPETGVVDEVFRTQR
jgi:hypothetical protein